MARRLCLVLTLACALLAAPAAAQAAADLHVHSEASEEPATGKEALDAARELLDGEGVRTGFELTPVLKVLAEKLPELEGADRRRAQRLLARPTQGQGNPGESTYSVPEAPPVCGPHFCVHYVATTGDAPPSIDYVNRMLAEFENVFEVENNQMGWRTPVPDGTAGGDARTDVYIKNVGPEGLYGYAATDPNQQGRQRAAYLVLDNDYSEEAFRRYNDPVDPLQVTAAHEYNHVLQFGYDVAADGWMFEATATWMEDKVYDDINDYLGYLGEWVRRTAQPLTTFFGPESGESNAKVYGDAVFNRWIDERFGADTIRRTWEVSVATESFAPASYDRALGEKGQNFFDVFTAFTADTAEWRTSRAFEEGETYPDIPRELGSAPLVPQTVTRRRGPSASGSLDHTAYYLLAVNPSGEDRLTLGATLRRGVAGAIGLVGLNADGTAVVRLTRLRRGGAGRAVLENAASFQRVTAIVVNSHIGIEGFSESIGDWVWTGDGAPVSVALNDFTTPTVRRQAPKPGARRVSTGSRVTITFNEAMAGITSRDVRLIGPRNRTVRATVAVSEDGKLVRLTPRSRLARGTRYKVLLSTSVRDNGGNRLPSSKRTWSFRTGR